MVNGHEGGPLGAALGLETASLVAIGGTQPDNQERTVGQQGLPGFGQNVLPGVGYFQTGARDPDSVLHFHPGA